MAQVIGVPHYRGNSEIYRAVKLHKNGADFTDYFEGQAVYDGAGDDATVYSTFGQNKGFQILIGFIHDINMDSGVATLVVSAQGVTLPSVGGASEADAVSIDLATGKIGTGAAGERLINAVIKKVDGVFGANGKTGVAVADCVNIRTNGVIEDLGAVGA